MGLNRRQFFQGSIEAALAAGTWGLAGFRPARAESADPPPGPAVCPIVDTHQHLWDLSKFRLPWLENDRQLRRTFAMEDYLEAARGLNVVKAIYMEVAVEPSQQLAEAEYVIELCRRADNPTVAAVIGGRPAADDFRQYISRFKGSPYVKGVRQIVDDPKEFLEAKFVRGIRLLGELGMSFDLCLPAARLRTAAELVDRCPETRFVLDHCGNADPKAFGPVGRPQNGGARPRGGTSPAPRRREAEHDADGWRRDIGQLAERKHVICKISGIVARAPRGNWTADDLAPIIDHCIDTFGPERVVFGGDWPVCTRVASLRQWVEALQEVIRGRSHQQQRNLLHDNAVRFYGLA
jgi:L-fuconolactonase